MKTNRFRALCKIPRLGGNLTPPRGSERGSAGKGHPGFALVVTLSLMILLTVVAVGLLSLATISLRSADKTEAAARAQANAKLALMMALGDLQRELGPDSRISAAHNAGTTATGGQPKWTAVYDAWKRADDRETPAARQEKFRGWLVSGANVAQGGPAGTAETVQLLTKNSLGMESPDNEIEVPLHSVTTSQRKGRMGWWVADEGVKAKINAGPDANAASTFAKADPFFHTQAPPKIGHQAIPALSAFEWTEGQKALTISTGEVNLAANLERNALGTSIHDLTVHSAGVLADVRAGRLKRDLSHLLSRPHTELLNKPLYLADGRVNWLNINPQGGIQNATGVPNTWNQGYNTANHWGINFEELQLFHSLHREFTWTGGQPRLVMKNTREAVVQDRHFIYRRPTIQALQFIFSLTAVPDTAAGRYKMQINMDAMVSLSNPNDVPIEYPRGLALPFQLLNIPYNLSLTLQKSGVTSTTPATTAPNLSVFKGHVEGGASGSSPAGFTLQPGEAAVFGSSTASGYDLNLNRGFVPSGGVSLANWNLQANNLLPSDKVDYELKRAASTSSANAWTYYNAWVGARGPGSIGWQIDSAALFGGSLENTLMDQYLPRSMRATQVRSVSDFIGKPQPMFMLSFLQNVEQSPNANPPDGFASRPILLNESALNERSMNPDRAPVDRHATQLLITAEPLTAFRTLAAGAGGRNMYIGGGRQPNLGGSFNVVARRVPLTPPMSIGSFQNAIASGFCDHFADQTVRAQVGGNPLAVGGDPFPGNAAALTGHLSALPLVSRAIGNSHTIPHLDPQDVFSASNNTTAARGAVGRVATDHSWMANTALWDSWFLSSIVDGTGAGGSAWMDDSRSPSSQFKDFAEGKRSLRNKRYLFHPHKAPQQALTALFGGGQNFTPAAVNLLANYLLVDGSFNVNSTSEIAWEALLSSVRGQQLVTSNGTQQALNHPFGTLGYATNTATTGTAGDWTGLRDLSDTDIKALAKAIATEVKSRGPFLSMADFVNRRPNSDNSAHQALGALQAAIDNSGLNDRLSTGNRKSDSADFPTLPGGDSIDDEPAPARAIGSPGHLSQGDLLTALGSQITVRSDTFVIRAYGDARDAADKVIATAYCEAVVQRLPEYVDPTDSPEAGNGWPDAASKLTPANTTFGRRFVVQSFRWLAKEEI